MSGLPFRLELRREVGGVRYYDDSFSSAPGSCIAAIDAVTGPKVMIIGGHDRMLDLSQLAEHLAKCSSIRKVVLIGASAKRTAEAFDAAGFTNYVVTDAKTMPEVIAEARKHTQSGDAVVLSPAFPSFDMFKNFEDRGNKFNEAVEAL
jgi:UDP-N-acetylmuramoylalanine--D-glutamate ligase